MEQQKDKGDHCSCPFCDEEMADVASPFCQACRVAVFYCSKCRKPLSRENTVCPECGTEIKA